MLYNDRTSVYLSQKEYSCGRAGVGQRKNENHGRSEMNTLVRSTCTFCVRKLRKWKSSTDTPKQTMKKRKKMCKTKKWRVLLVSHRCCDLFCFARALSLLLSHTFSHFLFLPDWFVVFLLLLLFISWKYWISLLHLDHLITRMELIQVLYIL